MGSSSSSDFAPSSNVRDCQKSSLRRDSKSRGTGLWGLVMEDSLRRDSKLRGAGFLALLIVDRDRDRARKVTSSTSRSLGHWLPPSVCPVGLKGAEG